MPPKTKELLGSRRGPLRTYRTHWSWWLDADRPASGQRMLARGPLFKSQVLDHNGLKTISAQSNDMIDRTPSSWRSDAEPRSIRSCPVSCRRRFTTTRCVRSQVTWRCLSPVSIAPFSSHSPRQQDLTINSDSIASGPQRLLDLRKWTDEQVAASCRVPRSRLASAPPPALIWRWDSIWSGPIQRPVALCLLLFIF
jgi:hypothetical protein